MRTALVRAGIVALVGGAAATACTSVDLYFAGPPACDITLADASAPDGGPDRCNCSKSCDCSGDGSADYQMCLALADAGDAAAP